jgi:DNA replication protein DnaC
LGELAAAVRSLPAHARNRKRIEIERTALKPLPERRRARPPPHRTPSCRSSATVGKILATFDFGVVPMVSKAQVMALASGDSWLEKGANLLLFGPPGAGKSHLAAAIGLALVENGRRVLFMRTSELVQRLLDAASADNVRGRVCSCAPRRHYSFA